LNAPLNHMGGSDLIRTILENLVYENTGPLARLIRQPCVKRLFLEPVGMIAARCHGAD
jgi:hypothetical protein